ncbi:hypothetical protein NFI96_026344, partial [Prochilodus magdalenae]
RSKVVGPAAPLVAEVGKDLVLPCALQPNISAVDMMVEWIRPNQIETNKLVHLYEDHEDKNNVTESLNFFCFSLLPDKFSEKKLSPAQCSAIAYMQLKSQYVHEELDLNKYNTSDEGYRRLIPAMVNYRKACFVGCNLTVESIKRLSAALQTKNSALKELDLSNNDLQDSGVELLSDGLRNVHCKMEILSTSTLPATLNQRCDKAVLLATPLNPVPPGMDLLSAGLRSSFCKLEILRLALCNFGEKSCDELGSVLQTETSNLKELDISNNELHDSGVEKLSAGLKSSHCKLEILSSKFEPRTPERTGSDLQSPRAIRSEVALC